MAGVGERRIDQLERALLERVDALREPTVALLRELVRVNSTNPSHPAAGGESVIGGETRCNEILRERYAEAGLATHWVAEDPARKNLVAVRAGAGGGRSLILNGHVDTVAPVEADGWNFGPWSAAAHEERIFGLGATDMKGGLAATWTVVQALDDLGLVLAGDVLIHSVVGEEAMEHELGTTACIRAGFGADAAVVLEPTSTPRPLTVAVAAPGYLMLRITVEGRSTHCGNRALAVRPGGPGDAIGVNALEKGVMLVRLLQDLEAQWGLTKSHPWFPPGAFTLMPGVFHSDSGMEAIAPVYFANRATIEYSIWYPPDEPTEDVIAEIEEHVSTGCRLDPWLREHPPVLEWPIHWPPMQTPWDHPLVQGLVGAHERASGSSIPAPSPQAPASFGAACDATFLDRAGIPTVMFGPGDIRIAHCRDESVSVDEVLQAARSLALFVLDWCGPADGPSGSRSASSSASQL